MSRIIGFPDLLVTDSRFTGYAVTIIKDGHSRIKLAVISVKKGTKFIIKFPL